jgi:hypothetical protein
MSQSTSQLQTAPVDCRIVPDLFGFTIHMNGAKMYVLHEHLDSLLLNLIGFQEHQDRIAMGDEAFEPELFPELTPAALARTAGE